MFLKALMRNGHDIAHIFHFTTLFYYMISEVGTSFIINNILVCSLNFVLKITVKKISKLEESILLNIMFLHRWEDFS